MIIHCKLGNWGIIIYVFGGWMAGNNQLYRGFEYIVQKYLCMLRMSCKDGFTMVGLVGVYFETVKLHCYFLETNYNVIFKFIHVWMTTTWTNTVHHCVKTFWFYELFTLICVKMCVYVIEIIICWDFNTLYLLRMKIQSIRSSARSTYYWPQNGWLWLFSVAIFLYPQAITQPRALFEEAGPVGSYDRP